MRICDLTKDMRQFVGGGYFITLKELTQFLGRKDAKSVKAKYLIGLPREGTRYFIPDVARVIYEGRNIT